MMGSFLSIAQFSFVMSCLLFCLLTNYSQNIYFRKIQEVKTTS